jgi:hypothetical protein
MQVFKICIACFTGIQMQIACQPYKSTCLHHSAHLSITADVKYMDFYIHQNNGYFSNEQVDRQTDRRTDGRTHRKMDSQTDGQTDLRKDRPTDRRTNEQTDLQTDRPTDEQTAGYGPKDRKTD